MFETIFLILFLTVQGFYFGLFVLNLFTSRYKSLLKRQLDYSTVIILILIIVLILQLFLDGTLFSGIVAKPYF